MTREHTVCVCLNCQRPETMIPMVALRYNGDQAWICSQRLPVLIHQPQRLNGRLVATENLIPAQHED